METLALNFLDNGMVRKKYFLFNGTIDLYFKKERNKSYER